jgi:hypothetical protein
MRRPLTLLVAGLFTIAAGSTAFLIDDSPVSGAPIADAPITYCADPDTDPSMDTGGGTMITCVTEITNTVTAIDPISGVASGTAHVKVTECTGPANGRLDPNDLTCTEDEQDLVNLVTHVDQCNEVGYGGGNVLECSVEVTTNFVGVSPQAILAATVDQCNVPQDEGLDKTGCDPFPATTTNATITQCNDSSYGGGQEDFNCLATGSTTSASLSVTVDQCNNSNYGGGSWLNCSASLSNNVEAVEPTPTPTLAPTNAPTSTPTLAPTLAPTSTPTLAPTLAPTSTPTLAPTNAPASTPTLAPTNAPASTPTLAPTNAPASTPTSGTDHAPASTPTLAPSPTAAAQPAASPSASPGLPDTSTAPGPTPQSGGMGPLLHHRKSSCSRYRSGRSTPGAWRRSADPASCRDP